MIILLSGKAGSGKDFTADILSKMLVKKGMDVIKLSFARYIKSDALFMGWNNKKDASGRKLLQNLGKVYREYDKDIFVKKVIDDIIDYRAYDSNAFIVTDCRFINEIEGLENEFDDVIKVRIDTDREYIEDWQKDESECCLDSYDKWDYIVINNFEKGFNKKVKQVGECIMRNLFGYNKYLTSHAKCSAVPKKTELIFEFPNGFIASLLHEDYNKIDIDITNPELNEGKVSLLRVFMGDSFLTINEAKEVLKYIEKM